MQPQRLFNDTDRNQRHCRRGNVAFEDPAFLCESKGFATGIDIEKLVAVRAILRSEMPGEALYGGMARAGLPGGTLAGATA